MKKKFCLTGRVSHAHGSVRQPISTEYLIVGILRNMHVCTPPIVINLTTKHKQRLYICICVNRSIKQTSTVTNHYKYDFNLDLDW